MLLNVPAKLIEYGIITNDRITVRLRIVAVIDPKDSPAEPKDRFLLVIFVQNNRNQ